VKFLTTGKQERNVHWRLLSSGIYVIPAALFPAYFLLADSCLNYSLTLKIKVICSSEKSSFHWTRLYVPEDRNFHNHLSENHTSYTICYHLDIQYIASLYEEFVHPFATFTTIEVKRKQLNICASVVSITYTSRHIWSPTARASCLFNGV
jgi:hypothetical protein